MYDLGEQILLSNYWKNLDTKGQYKFSETQQQQAQTILDSLSFWSKIMKNAHLELKNIK